MVVFNWRLPPPTSVLKARAVVLVWSPFQTLALCFIPLLFQCQTYFVLQSAKWICLFSFLVSKAALIRTERLLLHQLFFTLVIRHNKCKGNCSKGVFFFSLKATDLYIFTSFNASQKQLMGSPGRVFPLHGLTHCVLTVVFCPIRHLFLLANVVGSL